MCSNATALRPSGSASCAARPSTDGRRGCSIASSRPADRWAVEVREPSAPRRIVILGGGFGGVGAAQRLERVFARSADIEITIVSSSNYLLFTPMLAEVASSALRAEHISAPIRAAFYLLEARYNPWWITRNEAEAEMARARHAQLLTSAPALWAFIVFLPLFVVITLSPGSA